MKPSPADDPARVQIRVVQAVTIASAVTALPANMFASGWLLLFCLPGAGFALLSSVPAARAIGFVQRSGIAVAAVIALSIALWRATPPPAPQAALTYLLLPPLAYAALRRRPLDVLHSLFLALCLLLSAGILRGAPAVAHVAVFVVGSALVLQQEAMRLARTRAVAARVARVRWWTRPLSSSGVAAACAIAVIGVFSALRNVVSAPSDDPTTQVGLGGSFDLRSGRGPLNLIEDELVEVRAAEPLPEDLYLRCEHYEVAGIEAWTPARRSPGAVLDLRRRGALSLQEVPGLPSRSLDLRPLMGATGYVYAPPGTHELSGELSLLYDRDLAAFSRAPAAATSYALRYQDLTVSAAGRAAYAPIPGLTQLPAEVTDRADYDILATELTRGVEQDPTSIALAIVRGLQERCTYALEEPSGPSRFALDNFLFGNKRGYCQHFASALAVLLRWNSVPCRIASGLFGGTVDRYEPTTRVFGSRDAHAWVEIPLDGLGWVPFDATPPAMLQLRELTPLVPHSTDPGDDRSASGSDGLHRWWAAMRTPLVWPWLLLAAVIAVRRFRPAPRAPVAAAPRPPARARAAHRALRRILATLAGGGMPRAPGETLEHYTQRLRRRVHRADAAPLWLAFDAYQRVRFGDVAWDEPSRRSLIAGLQAARAIAATGRLRACDEIDTTGSEMFPGRPAHAHLRRPTTR